MYMSVKQYQRKGKHPKDKKQAARRAEIVRCFVEYTF